MESIWIKPNKIPKQIAEGHHRTISAFKEQQKYLHTQIGSLYIENIEIQISVGRAGHGTKFMYVAHCICKCGVYETKRMDHIRYGDGNSGLQCAECGRKTASKSRSNSGEGGRTKEEYAMYNRLYLMNDRCYNPSSESYINYGARGIKICNRWRIDKQGARSATDNFIEDMGLAPAGLSIDRIDNNGHYTPKNCQWANAKEQANNRRRNAMFKYKGKVFSQTELCAYFAEKYNYTGSIRHKLAKTQDPILTERWLKERVKLLKA